MKGALKSIILVTAIAAVLASVPAAAQEATGGLRYSITVTKFENQAGWQGYWDIGDAWGTVLTDMLNQSGKFIVLGESDMRAAALDEQDFAASGRTAGGAKAPVTGQMTPAQILVKGAITHVQGDTAGADGGIRIKGFKVGGGGGKGEVNATVYLVDSTTGQVLASTNVVGTHKRKALGVGYDAGDVSYLLVGPGEALVDYHGTGFNLGYSQWFDAHWGLNARLDYGETPFYTVRGASLSVFREW